MSELHPRLRENVERVGARLAAACRRAGRDPQSVRLVAVTKYAELRWVEQLPQLGVRLLGESRPQQLVERAGRISGPIEWHLIGHLQRNKVRPVLPVAAVIHSVDSLKLLERIDSIAGELGLSPRVLLEVNVSGEASKDGITALELRECVRHTPSLAHVRVSGLMTMAPLSDDPESARPVFRGLRALRDELRTAASPCDELSMGMSHDFEVAIEEGATYVRIGSLLFDGVV